MERTHHSERRLLEKAHVGIKQWKHLPPMTGNGFYIPTIKMVMTGDGEFMALFKNPHDHYCNNPL